MTPIVRVGDRGEVRDRNHDGCDNIHRYLAPERKAGTVQRKVIPFLGNQEPARNPWGSIWNIGLLLHPIVGMTNSASDRAPVGQRVVMVLSRV
jgi:hypothetical protein